MSRRCGPDATCDLPNETSVRRWHGGPAGRMLAKGRRIRCCSNNSAHQRAKFARLSREPTPGLEPGTPSLRGPFLSRDRLVCRAFRSVGCPQVASEMPSRGHGWGHSFAGWGGAPSNRCGARGATLIARHSIKVAGHRPDPACGAGPASLDKASTIPQPHHAPPHRPRRQSGPRGPRRLLIPQEQHSRRPAGRCSGALGAGWARLLGVSGRA